MGREMVVLLALGGMLLGAALGYTHLGSRGAPKIKGFIRVSGNFEVTDAEVSFKIPGRVEQRFVEEGEGVEAGQPIARLENKDILQEVALRKAEVAQAQAQLLELERGARPQEIAQAEAAVQRASAFLSELLAGSRPQEIKAAEAALSRARAELQRWRTDHERQRQLFQRGVISAREYEAVLAAYQTAQAQVQEAEEKFRLVKEGPRPEQIAQAKAAVREARERWALVMEGPRKETIEAARARLEQAKALLAAAETRLDYTLVVSPIKGVVLSKNVEPGEYVAPGTPVVTVGDLEHIWLRAYIDEPDLGRVKLGQKVRVSTDTYPGKIYEGKISFISSQAEFTPKNVQTEKERVKLVYRVKIDVANPQMELKPGMPGDAEILLDGQ
ncbi:MAG: efflux RND transporter periplasmic adaptor subunit [bacterium]